jgi:DNA-3-methyladenine glycosylase II
VRRRPWLRASRRPEPFEAFVWAVCEQLIEYEQAVVIQRQLVARLGRRWMDEQASPSGLPASPSGLRAWAGGLRDSPAPVALAGASPALLESCGLSPTRALALRKAAHEVAAGRVDLHDSRPERGWQRLRAIRGIGAWTVEILALCGQGRYDQLPAGDLGLLKLAGRLLSGGNPCARASEQQVRELFAPYGEWAGLAAVHAAGL